MDDSLDDAMVYVYAAVPTLLLVAAIATTLTRKWKTAAIARRRHRQMQARRTLQARPMTVTPKEPEPVEVATAFDAVGQRMEAVLAKLDRLDTRPS